MLSTIWNNSLGVYQLLKRKNFCKLVEIPLFTGHYLNKLHHKIGMIVKHSACKTCCEIQKDSQYVPGDTSRPSFWNLNW